MPLKFVPGGNLSRALVSIVKGFSALVGDFMVVGCLTFQGERQGMRRDFRGFTSIWIACAMLTVCQPVFAMREGGWYESLDEARRIARREGKPILADFSTSWCHNCRDLEKNTFHHPAVVERLDSFVKVYVDGDRHPDICQQFGVEGFPTLVAMSPSGREIDRSIGYVNGGTLASTLDGVIQSVGPVKSSQPAAEQTASEDTPYNLREGAKQSAKSSSKLQGKQLAQQLPKPLLDVGATRDSDTGSETPSKASSKDKVKQTSESASSEVKPGSEKQEKAKSAPAEDAKRTDPLATVRKLEGKGQKGAAADAKSQDEESTQRTTVDVRSKRKGSDSGQGEEASPKGGSKTSAKDIERWIKDADTKMQTGRKNEARAMYSKVVENDPKNVHGHSDLAYIKMVSLIVDRNDDFLRKQAYEKIKEFPTRYPQSTHQDYYTLIRAMLAQDLGESDEAYSLLQDYPARFPNSPYADMAYQTWKSLGNSGEKPESKKSASKSGSSSKSQKKSTSSSKQEGKKSSSSSSSTGKSKSSSKSRSSSRD